MGMLDPTVMPQTMPQTQPQQGGGLLSSIQQMSPDLISIGMGMLNAAGPSRMPVSMGQAMAAGYSNMQNTTQQNLANQLTQSQVLNDQLKYAMAVKQMQNIQNILGLLNGGGNKSGKATANQVKTATKALESQQLAAANPGALPGLGGGLLNAQMQDNSQPAAQAPAQTSPDATAQGNGLLNNPQDIQRQIAMMRIAGGDLDTGLEMLGMGGDYSDKPIVGMDANGNPVYQLADKYGNTKTLKGLTPPQKDYMFKPTIQNGGLMWDPGTNQFVVSPGFGGASSPLLNASNFNNASGTMGVPAVMTPQGNAMARNPLMTPGRGTLGATFYDPRTGKQISIDTSRMASIDQQSIAGADRAIPQLEIMKKTLPQFQDGWTQLERMGGSLLNMSPVHTNFQLPTDYASGQSALSGSLESVMKAFGFPNTNEGQAKAEQMIAPRFGESEDQYRARLGGIINHLKEFSSQAKGRLGQGIQLNDDSQATQDAQQPQAPMSLEDQARDAIAKGAPRDQVMARLKNFKGQK